MLAVCAITLLLGLRLAWLETREPPEIEQSQTLRVGMTQTEVEAVMGVAETWRVEPYGGDYRMTMLFDQSVERKQQQYDAIRDWTSDLLPPWSPAYEDWAVRVRINRRGGRVDRIERGNQVEGADP